MFKFNCCKFIILLYLIHLTLVSVKSSDTKVTDEEWENYKRKFNKEYDTEEDIIRRQIYEATKKEIIEHNKRYDAGDETFRKGINQFTDKRPQEVPKGFRLPSNKLQLNKVL
ncbi:cystein proteinase inhibitor protein salarin-like [Condylostylus longicornis]|uniref:cystein proteinase inhibitor protein salarin-like n=1 Tax=Condylostylus longicornis TaxID=2530218 RepID=UPI00244E1FAD|nr:cystein proteinase inhibitor protein salarin-like [Condylostylus longicornis]